MPRGVPRLGQKIVDALTASEYQPKNPHLSSAAEELLQAPTAKVLGEIPLNPDGSVSTPEAAPSTWTSPTGETLTLEEPPPPWETDPRYFRHNSDARRFIRCPENIELRWLSPRLIDQVGLREWAPVPAKGDPKFRVLNRQLIRPDNTIRRGGPNGDILCWMWKSWVESRRRLRHEAVERRARSAIEKHQAVREQLRRGAFGRHVTDAGGVHPTHTGAVLADRD